MTTARRRMVPGLLMIPTPPLASNPRRARVSVPFVAFGHLTLHPEPHPSETTDARRVRCPVPNAHGHRTIVTRQSVPKHSPPSCWCVFDWLRTVVMETVRGFPRLTAVIVMVANPTSGWSWLKFPVHDEVPESKIGTVKTRPRVPSVRMLPFASIAQPWLLFMRHWVRPKTLFAAAELMPLFRFTLPLSIVCSGMLRFCPGGSHGPCARNERMIVSLWPVLNPVQPAVSLPLLETWRFGSWQLTPVQPGGNSQAGAAIGRHGATPCRQ